MKRTSKLGQKIREARLARSFTQAQLADRCGLKTSQISALETDSRAKLRSAKVAVKMAKALNISALELLEMGHPEFQWWHAVLRAA